ncbi:hypothetical protein SO802_019750 [Lithocarpus litseifolius]|uniref:Uncharacterized protein n=1 Tax=Lithocarpus litseifolius TaxID=425828 RepID=A0AAW2CRK9_9ROSI
MLRTDAGANAEAYSPSLAARQFGLIQAIPVPFMTTCNEPWQDRHSISLDKSFELHQQSLKDLKSFKFYPFKITPDVIPTFSSWWSTYISEYNENVEMAQALNTLCPPFLRHNLIGNSICFQLYYYSHNNIH